MFTNRNGNQYIQNGYSGQMPQGGPFYYNTNNRNYPYPIQGSPPQAAFQWPQQLLPYYQGGFQPFQPQMQQQFPTHQNFQPTSYMYPQKDTQFIFQNPLQPQEESYSNPYMNQHSYQTANPYINANPYPQNNTLQKQPGGMQSIMKSFKSQDGSVDFNKMVNTAGQMMNAVNQVSSLVKGFGGFFKV
ncbi:MAG: YppG family protein [Bacillota bacterium]|nr:YppG family protein [Bacillota bacterium]